MVDKQFAAVIEFGQQPHAGAVETDTCPEMASHLPVKREEGIDESAFCIPIGDKKVIRCIPDTYCRHNAVFQALADNRQRRGHFDLFPRSIRKVAVYIIGAAKSDIEFRNMQPCAQTEFRLRLMVK